MPTAAADSARAAALTRWQDGVWRWRAPALRGLTAGVVDRAADAQILARALAPRLGSVQAQQVHGASTACLLGAAMPSPLIPGCDALVTATPGLALAIRTADCLPILVWDPIRRAVGAMHAGWRGLQQTLPMRVVTVMSQVFGARASEVWAVIGPSIRPCCYDVGPEFEARFPEFVSVRDGRRICDLAACAAAQLAQAGVPAGQILDSGVCTGCDTARWFSVRKEGDGTGRLLSFAMIER